MHDDKVVQWSPSNANTVGTTTVCPEYGSGHISALGVMQACAVERYKAMFQSSPLLYVGEKG